MKILLLMLVAAAVGCSSAPKPGNNSGLRVKIESVKNHSEGVDLTLILENTTDQRMRVGQQGAFKIWLNDSDPISGHGSEVNIAPGERKKARIGFRFINSPKMYKTALVEIVPVKVFKTCSAADADPEVVAEEAPKDGREPSAEIQPDTCNRPLKDSIRIAF